MQHCIVAIRVWMAQNSLKIIDDKTEFIVIGSPANLSKVTTEHVIVGNHKIPASSTLRNIGAVFDSEMTMKSHVIRLSQTAWFHLRGISKIRAYLTQEQTRTVIHAYATSRLDQNNSLLSGAPTVLLDRLQKVQNAPAKIILGGRKYDHVTPLLKDLHWLPLSQRHVFKVLLLVYKCLQDCGPTYLQELLIPHVIDSLDRHWWIIWEWTWPAVWSIEITRSASWAPGCGMTYPASDMQSSKTVTIFKNSLKTHFLGKHICANWSEQ